MAAGACGKDCSHHGGPRNREHSKIPGQVPPSPLKLPQLPRRVPPVGDKRLKHDTKCDFLESYHKPLTPLDHWEGSLYKELQGSAVNVRM